jgi:lipopolysaccharide biosynthesis regulator YciM
MIRAQANVAPEPFIVKEDLKEVVEIKPNYEKVKNLEEWIRFLYQSAKEKNNFDMEHKIYQMIIEKFNKKAFNMSLIDSVSEKPVLQESNILTRRVLPLNHIYGYIFITS